MEHQFSIKKTFRCHTYGDAKTASKIWIILHGYGQLSKYFIRKFSTLDPKEHYIIAPEGMHRFYLKGNSGRVGASWMTKECREIDISDNNHYLNEIWQHFKPTCNPKAKKILLGFSQGGATATRWHTFGKFNAEYFVLWASVFPPDLNITDTNLSIFKSKNYFLVGDKDEYFDAEKVQALKNHFHNHCIDFKLINFEGNHNIDTLALNTLLTDLDEKMDK